MDKILTSQENGVEVKVEIPDNTPRYSVDGFGPALFGFPNTTLAVYQQQLADPAEKVQHRKVVSLLTIPTIAILELADNIRKTMSENKIAVEHALDQMKSIVNGKV
ncbi:hypothetical protein [Paraburkholderia sp. SIMBA_027]|uniref:hypothetical protein n=1 Tax=Paraburkholderia sp. SIMBA_027 TaxID=3085770 RepID=UPI00397C7C7A